MRRVTAPVREQPPGAVRASPIARALLIATLVGAFLALLGVHTAARFPFWGRLAHMTAISWTATLMAVGFSILTHRIGWARDRTLREAAISAALMTLPMGFAVWAGDRVLARTPPGLGALANYIYISFVISVFMNLLAWGLRRERTVVVVAEPPRAKFLDRLPLKLRGGVLWAVEAEDHYLRLHTDKGQDLILMRFADALGELEGAEGMQVHRSWWVARDGIAGVRREDGRLALVLKDQAVAPVSRTHAKALRQAGWLRGA